MSSHPRLTAIFHQVQVHPGPVGSILIALGELFVLSEEQIHAQWKVLAQDTALAPALLKIRLIPSEQQCMVCFEKYHPANHEVTCPHCGSVGAKILTGEELYLESIEGPG
jgi:Zn finger protein HypA/HybF involved in hydrogenase expression